MAKEKKTKFVILGFLLNDSLSGYEIGSIIRQSTNNFWHESDASIYPTLKLLANEQLVSSETIYSGKRKKEIFTITDAGRNAFKEWFKKNPDQDQHREEFLLKLFFTNEETEDQMLLHCKRKLQEMEQVREEYKKTEKMLLKEMPHKIYWLKTLQVGIAHIEVDISWLKQQISE